MSMRMKGNQYKLPFSIIGMPDKFNAISKIMKVQSPTRHGLFPLSFFHLRAYVFVFVYLQICFRHKDKNSYHTFFFVCA